ncbi:MAG: SDR family oxidoreductase [Bacteroidetes bacterium]|nr:SDR family oxidoreductase [Bacteroidota bacterium]MCW5893984.1 SDR family oxidoreductase [Bacteroidota bacterium]
MKNVLVTGGTGFIGSNLAEALLKRGCHVRILRRDHSDMRAIDGIDVEHCIGDVRNIESLRRAMKGCDTVFHTAALVTFEKEKAGVQRDVNVNGTRNVVQACLATGVERLVHTSSIAAIGYLPNGEPATEETPYNWPRTWGYKYSKHKSEQEILNGVEQGLHAVIVNPSVVVGERDIHFHGGDILRRVKKWQVFFYVDGGMNVVYVGDVVNGHIAAAEYGRSGERYILGGENLTHKDVFRRTARIVGGFSPVAKLPIPALRFTAIIIERGSKYIGIKPIITRDLVSGAGRYNWFSCEKVMREWRYTITPFEDAIRRAYSWYQMKELL